MNKPTFLQKLGNKPHNLLLFAGILLLVFPFIPYQVNNSADLHISDTYFVVDLPYFYWFMAVVTALMWALYILVKKYLYSTILTRIHVIGSVTITLLMALELAYNPINLRPRRYLSFGPHKWYDFSAQDLFLVAPIAMLLLVQPVFIVNIIGGLVKHNKNHHKSSQS